MAQLFSLGSMEAGEFSPVGFAAEILVVRFLVAGLIGSSCDATLKFRAFDLARLTPLGWFGSSRKSGGWF